ncbi:unnamed protein product [Darwinula stevensoni]|uniref:Uncharacterized protein n=1 Tax=Darwinula stevensoni TaxID=69355 RepID=A0A7R8X736_9CRUS|nr:unnamed protein product [Darwinula stevensoni]CAG0881903.1 unnamed protein product [Darwinula stevensoni]
MGTFSSLICDRIFANGTAVSARNPTREGLYSLQVTGALPAIDSRPPQVYTHLQMRLKRLQLEEERCDRIRRDNSRMLHRMADIIVTKRVDNSNPDHDLNSRLLSRSRGSTAAQSPKANSSRLTTPRPPETPRHPYHLCQQIKQGAKERQENGVAADDRASFPSVDKHSNHGSRQGKKASQPCKRPEVSKVAARGLAQADPYFCPVWEYLRANASPRPDERQGHRQEPVEEKRGSKAFLGPLSIWDIEAGKPDTIVFRKRDQVTPYANAKEVEMHYLHCELALRAAGASTDDLEENIRGVDYFKVKRTPISCSKVKGPNVIHLDEVLGAELPSPNEGLTVTFELQVEESGELKVILGFSDFVIGLPQRRDSDDSVGSRRYGRFDDAFGRRGGRSYDTLGRQNSDIALQRPDFGFGGRYESVPHDLYRYPNDAFTDHDGMHDRQNDIYVPPLDLEETIDSESSDSEPSSSRANGSRHPEWMTPRAADTPPNTLHPLLREGVETPPRHSRFSLRAQPDRTATPLTRSKNLQISQNSLDFRARSSDLDATDDGLSLRRWIARKLRSD